jgi:hypothetical protein
MLCILSRHLRTGSPIGSENVWRHLQELVVAQKKPVTRNSNGTSFLRSFQNSMAADSQPRDKSRPDTQDKNEPHDSEPMSSSTFQLPDQKKEEELEAGTLPDSDVGKKGVEGNVPVPPVRKRTIFGLKVVTQTKYVFEFLKTSLKLVVGVDNLGHTLQLVLLCYR